ncbi:MAG: type IV pilus twitching motility protein PilT [Planctomycetes bacterium]|nr:type IV pilus twitching motility protein PilT [Planctomycetota bacterium]
MASFEDLLVQLVKRGGSDLHITKDSPPRIRVDGKLAPLEGDKLTAADSQKLIYGLLDPSQVARFEKNKELDFSFGIEGLGRFRTNVFMQRGAVGAVLRIIPTKIKTFEDLGLSRQVCESLCNLPKGLILVTGATGSGKSTTLAAMIDFINTTDYGHIITVEDPIEFVHSNKNCLVNQREVGSDTNEFKNALRTVLRQDPDVVLIGEMRDTETTEAALTISETGHLTFGTLHTSDCVQTMNRIIDIFPAYQQSQIRTQLSFTLSAVFCQQLLPRATGKGRVLAAEIMLANSAIRSLIRDNKVHQIYSVIQTAGKSGMKTMNQSLYELYKSGTIKYDTALEYSSDPDDLKRLMQK